ncbi:MAG: hypothetical protein SGI98_02425 [Verrucomicrobiota bacterium]|nr:hypothetical protein [Verrucomicrobiota bacterium]
MRTSQRIDQGGVLLMVVILITIMSTILAVSLVSTNHYRSMSQRNQESIKIYYVAQSALEKNYSDLKTIIASKQEIEKEVTVNVLTTEINTKTLPTFVLNLGKNYQFSVNAVVPTDADGNPVNTPVDSNPDPYVRDYYFLSAAYTANENFLSKMQVQLEQPLKYSIRPIFYFGALYESDMEIHPSGGMNVSGRIHSNGSIYYGTTDGSPITFDGYVSAVNGIHNDYNPRMGTNNHPSTSTNVFTQKPYLTSGEKISGSEHIDASDRNPNNDSARELIEMPVNIQNNEVFTDELADERFYHKAGLKVIVNQTDNTVQYYTKDGTEILPTDGAIYQYMTNTFKIDGAFTDERINAPVSMVKADLSTLTDSRGVALIPKSLSDQTRFTSTAQTKALGINNKSYTSNTKLVGKELWNGIIYVGYKGSSDLKPGGVILMNGQTLPEGGLSVVSPNNLYVVGDYNSGGSGSNIPSNLKDLSADSTVTTVASGYTKKPAALIADSVTVLSGNWTTLNKTQKDMSLRKAVPTTVNAALLTGYSTPVAGKVEGFESAVKYLENWTGISLSIKGAFSSVFESVEGKTSPDFTPAGQPRRQWVYDQDFQNGQLPPGTPYIKTLKKGPVKKVY